MDAMYSNKIPDLGVAVDKRIKTSKDRMRYIPDLISSRPGTSPEITQPRYPVENRIKPMPSVVSTPFPQEKEPRVEKFGSKEREIPDYRGFDVRIVDDNATEDDYDTFYEGFRSIMDENSGRPAKRQRYSWARETPVFERKKDPQIEAWKYKPSSGGNYLPQIVQDTMYGFENSRAARTLLNRENLDKASDALSVVSLFPVVDTFADAAAISVDAMRGDWGSVALDAIGILPLVGEIADAKKTAKVAGKAVDAIKATDSVADTAKTIDKAEAVLGITEKPYSLRAHFDVAEDGVSEMLNMSDEILTTAPIKIPKNATVKPEFKKNNYYHMSYKWLAEDGYKYECRWHTRNPTAPKTQGDIWIVERRMAGIGYGKNYRKGTHEVLIGQNQWISKADWRTAISARKKKIITARQEEILNNGHWKIKK